MPRRNTRCLSPKAQEALRVRVVEALRGGLTKSAAARTFGVSRTSIDVWLAKVELGNITSLRSKKRGRKKGTRLAGTQAATIVRLIEDRCPDQLQLPFALWTREAVQQLIARRCGVKVAVRTVGRYLAAWGFTPQKPLRRAYERDPVAVQRWLDEEYPVIERRAKAEKTEIHWGDEMGLRSDHPAGRSYGRRGVTPVIPGTGQRFGCNLISTVTNRGVLCFMVFRQRFTMRVFICFLRRLLRQRRRRIFLIVDGHPVHRGQATARWVARHARRIELFELPGYSPDLNPDELLNQDVKTNALGRQRPADQAAMIAEVRSYLWSTQRQPEIVQSYFHEEHVRYAAG